MTKQIASFSVDYIQFLNEDGKLIQPLPAFAQNANHLLEMYEQLILVRMLDNKAVNLQRMGKMGTYPSSLGQEAASLGIAFAMEKEDVFVPYYRDQAAMIKRGVRIAELLSYWGGDERGNYYAAAEASEDFPIAIPVSSQCLHAVGVAYAIQYRKQKRAVVCSCGDGATSKGDFYEGINFAGIKKLPVVFVVNNNQWAISVPRHLQTAAQTIAQKSIAAGFEGIQVDGSDVIAVQNSIEIALKKAKNGEGPTLIEAMTYRLSDHTTADSAKRYRDENEVKAAWEKEPILRLKKYLFSQNILTETLDQSIQEKCSQEIENAVNEYLNKKPAPMSDIFNYLYQNLPEELLEQQQTVSHKKVGIMNT